MATKTALIVGSGGVLGAAAATEFSAAGYAVIGIRRNDTRALNATPMPFRDVHRIDFQDPLAMQRVADQVVEVYGGIDVVIYNAAHLKVAPFLELSISDFEESWRASLRGAAISAQAVLPAMLKRGCGCMIFSGATAALRGTAHFAAFASAKFALRGLAQSLAREFQSQGIHVAHVVIDGLLRGSASIGRFNGSNDNSIDPLAVARGFVWLAEQSPSAWTLELDMRPSSERF